LIDSGINVGIQLLNYSTIEVLLSLDVNWAFFIRGLTTQRETSGGNPAAPPSVSPFCEVAARHNM